ncbi:MAG: hypothetical protein R3C14_52445 [Caldilineaceae bacterium]
MYNYYLLTKVACLQHEERLAKAIQDRELAQIRRARAHSRAAWLQHLVTQGLTWFTPHGVKTVESVATTPRQQAY